MLVTQRIDNILNGVSEQPAELRHKSQAAAQVNCLSSSSRGVMKRPPVEHGAKILTDPTGSEGAFIHTVLRDASEQYRVVIIGDEIKVFDAITHAEYTVDYVDGGQSYLDGTSYRAVTVGDSTFIVNMDQAATYSSAKVSPGVENEAIVFVRQGDYSTPYMVTINGVSVSQTSAAEGAAGAKQQIATSYLADALYDLLVADTRMVGFEFALYGSSISIRRTDGADFKVSATDGLSDPGIKVVKGSVQSFDALPLWARDGMLIEVAGDRENKFDNYYVRYDASSAPNEAGVWRESLKPGVLMALDGSSMPHQLVRGGKYAEGLEIGGPPKPPELVGTFATTRQGFTTRKAANGTTTAVADTSTQILRDDLEELWLTPSSPNTRSAILNYAIDTTTMPPGSQVDVVLIVPGLTTSKRYSAGTSALRESITVGSTQLGAVANSVKVRLDYVGTTPTGSQRASLTVPGLNTTAATGGWTPGGSSTYTGAPFVHYEVQGNLVRIDANEVYPPGYQIYMTFNDLVVTFSTTADTLGSALSADLTRFIANLSGFLATQTWEGVAVSRSDASTPRMTIVVNAADNVNAYLSEAKLVDSAHIGRTVRNLSDGSSGTITGNTARSITVGGLLSGGATNRFRMGDKVEIVGTGTYFTFGPVPWREREVGDMDTSPWPSFVGRRIREVFFYQNRLGFLTPDTIILSATGDLFNFFRQTATDLLPDDFIDVSDTQPFAANYESAEAWNGGMYIWCSQGPFVLTGEPVLSPQTVRLDFRGRYPIDSRVRPFVAGSRLFAARARPGSSQVLEITDPPQESMNVSDSTVHVPSLIPGRILGLTGDPALGFLAVHTGGRSLYVHLYAFREDGYRMQSSWSRWDLPAGSTILHIEMSDGVLGIITKRADGVFYETISLSGALDYSL